jgi:hypothetical protein
MTLRIPSTTADDVGRLLKHDRVTGDFHRFACRSIRERLLLRHPVMLTYRPTIAPRARDAELFSEAQDRRERPLSGGILQSALP